MYKTFEELVSVKPVGITMPILEGIPDAEGLIAYAARVSNPSNQMNFETADRLLAYCARRGHWSVFDMCNLVLEIKAPRDISRQLLRHQSIKFQEFSQRYAEVTDDMFCLRECRLQDSQNRQNSFKTADSELNWHWEVLQQVVLKNALESYNEALRVGIAKEVARTLLPEGLTMSCLYANGTARSWLHYIGVRTERNVTQSEHCDVADAVKEEFLKYFPSLAVQLEIKGR